VVRLPVEADDDIVRNSATHRSTRRIEGDLHIGTMAADIPLVPGSTTPAGAAAIERQMRRVLARVQRDVARSEDERRRWPRWVR
jgi:hypothetical protein